MVYGLVLIVGVSVWSLAPRSGAGQTPPAPRPLPAAWAMSGNEGPGRFAPSVIATSQSAQPVIVPAEARISLPDDGLHSPRPATGTARAGNPPALFPLSVRPTAGPIQPAHYRGEKDSSAEILPVAAGPPPGPRSLSASQLAVEVFGPTTAAPGQPLAYQVVVRNVGTAVLGDVHVDLPLANGVRPLSVKPEAQRQGGRLSWQLGNLDPHAERRLELELQVSETDHLHLAPIARFTAAMALRASVVRPPFAITVNGPESAMLGEKVVFKVQVGNHSSETIRRITLRGELSAGLIHPQGQIIEADLTEDLPPGQSRTIELVTQAAQIGQQRLVLQATAEHGRSAQTTAALVVHEPVLNLSLAGPRTAAAGQPVEVKLDLVYPSQKTVPIRVIQTVPDGVEFISASGGGVYSPVRQTIVWNLTEMPVEQRQSLTCQFRARQEGDWAFAAVAQSGGATPVRATHAVRIEAIPSLSVELTALDDRLNVGQETTYEVRVYNAGPGSARGLRLVANLPPNLLPVRAEGPTAWRITTQQVFFEPLAELRGRFDAVYRLRVRGQQAGQGRLRAEIHAISLTRPLQQELSAQVAGTIGPSR
jgi:uncharacterized repeat protein (TIGR01451 family)